MACFLGELFDEGAEGYLYLDSKREDVVIKVFQSEVGKRLDTFPATEIDILFRLESPHLLHGLQIYEPGECASPDKALSVALERLTGGIKALAGISFPTLKRVFLDLAQGLKCLDLQNYLHTDIHEDNCLYRGSTSNPIGVLIDFGQARTVSRDLEGIATPVEVGRSTYTEKDDIYDLANVYLHILIGRSRTEEAIYSVLHNPSVANITTELKLILPESDLELTAKLLSQMLDPDSKSRIDIYQTIADPFFDSVRDSQSACTALESKLVAGPISRSQYQGLIFLIGHIRWYWSATDISFLFGTIDLYLRLIPQLDPDSDPEPWAIACALIACKLFVFMEVPVPYVNLSPEVERTLWLHECRIAKLLGGQLRRSDLYDYAGSPEALTQAFRDFILNPKARYLEANLGAYFEALDLDLANKTMMIFQFMDALDPEREILDRSEVQRVESKIYSYNCGFQYLLDLLTTRFQDRNTQFFFRVVDIWLREMATGAYPTELQDLASAVILATDEDVKLLALSELSFVRVQELASQIKARKYANPIPEEMTTLGEQSVIYHEYLNAKTLDGRYQILTQYSQLAQKSILQRIKAEAHTYYNLDDPGLGSSITDLLAYSLQPATSP